FPGYPAFALLPEGIIFVGGMREVDEFRPESNYGSYIDIIAPADSLTGLAGHTSDNATINSGGNSNAAPMVAGICAMILEENPHASVQRVIEILTQQANLGVLTSMPPNTVNALACSLAGSTDWVTHADVGSPPYVIDSLEPGTEYEVQVRRTTAAGTSDWSASDTATTAAFVEQGEISAGAEADALFAAVSARAVSFSAGVEADSAMAGQAAALAAISTGVDADSTLSGRAAAIASITEALEAGDVGNGINAVLAAFA